jgi:hypothetical protein
VSNYKGNTPLHEAAWVGNKEIIEMLIERGADVDTLNDEGNTPLHESAYNGYKKIAQVLMRNGADTSVKNHDGYTASQVVVMNRHTNSTRHIQGSPNTRSGSRTKASVRKRTSAAGAGRGKLSGQLGLFAGSRGAGDAKRRQRKIKISAVKLHS